jgi:hypothetical protein
MGCLYILEFPNGKRYVGITKHTAEHRFIKGHLYSRHLVGKALMKYGKESVVITTLFESDDWDELCALEVETIKCFNTLRPNGYNLTVGGDGVAGYTPTEAHREKVSLSLTKYNSSDAVRLRKSSDAANYWARVGVAGKVAHGELISKSRSTDESRLKTSIASREMWEDADRSYRRSLAMRKWHAENKEFAKNNLAKIASDPDIQARRRASMRKRFENPDVRAAQGDPTRGRLCVNDGVSLLRVLPDELESYLANGYTRGYIKKGVSK